MVPDPTSERNLIRKPHLVPISEDLTLFPTLPTYARAYPPPLPLEGVGARQVLTYSAAPVNAGDFQHPRVLHATQLEFQFRAAALGYTDITPEEVYEAEMCMRAIEAEHVSTDHVGRLHAMIAAAIQPLVNGVADLQHQVQRLKRALTERGERIQARLTEALANDMQSFERRYERALTEQGERFERALTEQGERFERALTEQGERIQARLAEALAYEIRRFQENMQNDMQRFERRYARDMAEVRNTQRAMLNRRMDNNAQRIRTRTRLAPLIVTGAPGNGVVGMPAFHPPVEIPIGEDLPAPPFPATFGGIDVMTEQQIDELAVYANDDFGIVRGDTIDQQRIKFLNFVIGNRLQ